MTETIQTTEIELKSCRLGELLGALSYALDLTEGQEAGHGIRSCFIGMRIGQKIGLSEPDLADLYYTVLLKDLGCSSNAARICQLYLTDDRVFKGDFKKVDGSIRKALAFALRHTANSEPIFKKARVIFDVLSRSDALITEIFTTRCETGADIARQMGFSDRVARGISALDEHWDGHGRPYRLAGPSIPLFSRIALVAQVFEVFSKGVSADAAIDEVSRRSGTWFDPEIVNATLACSRDPDFWRDLFSADLEERVFAMPPAQDEVILTESRFDDIIQAFSRVIDAKSPFTHGHSRRVSIYADLLAQELNFSTQGRRQIRHAALLHDIGKLGVSNQILDKKEALTDSEFEIIKSHPSLGEAILARIPAFGSISRIAATHHERLDGKGYPHGLTATHLTQEMRLVSVADVFDALSAERPYRAALPLDEVRRLMTNMANAALDDEILKVLWKVLDSSDFQVIPAS